MPSMGAGSNDTCRPDGTCGLWKLDRYELAGSFGDLGTLLPLAIGMILLCGLDATAVFVTVGAFYLLCGLYFRTTVPVQPMKVIGAYAIAQGLSPATISLAGLWMAAILLVLALSGAITLVGRVVPRPTVRGVQLTTGVLLFVQGIRFIAGTSSLQQAQGRPEPFLAVQSLGPVPIGLVLGVAAVILILLLLDNRRVPAALAVLMLGVAAGLALGGWRGLAGFDVGLHHPRPLPYGLPDWDVWVLALTALALPQAPMTVGNAVIAQADLTRSYFGPVVARRMTFRALAASMGLANLAVAAFGGMPLCHGAGGLAAHYRFGARTLTSNLMIGSIFLLLGVLVGDRTVALLGLVPLSVLGALLVFAGAQLALMILDVDDRGDLFVVISMLAVSLVSNLAVGFAVGILLAYLFRMTRLKV